LDQGNLYPWSEMVYSSETLAAIYLSATQRHNLGHNINLGCHENLKTYIR
jgi:predicted Zn-dependent protease